MDRLSDVICLFTLTTMMIKGSGRLLANIVAEESQALVSMQRIQVKPLHKIVL